MEDRSMQVTRRTFLGTSAAALAALTTSSTVQEKPTVPKQILILAGPPSHSFGAHEHPAGCRLLADRLGMVGGVEARAINGWPEDEKVFEGIDALIIFGDGDSYHPLKGHFDALEPLAERGVGLGFLHYAVIVEGKKPLQQLLDWTGGAYEHHWSVNPVWTAKITSLPEHPITRGVKPFTLRDEWYYHMRFRPGMTGVQPLLTTLPPASSLERPDGPHSGNPHVRKAVLEDKQPQHLAWCTERKDGGRGFGFTGLHWHWNWAHDDFRTIILNACCWLAKAEIPTKGIASKTPSLDELIELVGEPPEEWKREVAQEMIDRFD
jgi:hypothetical protein